MLSMTLNDVADLEVQEAGGGQVASDTEKDKNIGEVPSGGSTARFIGYIIIALVITFGLLSMGMCALWCRRQYKRYFIEERRQRENLDEIAAGQVHHGMYKNAEGDWEVVGDASRNGQSIEDITYGDQQDHKSGGGHRPAGPGKGHHWQSPDISEDDTAQRAMATERKTDDQEDLLARARRDREGRPSGPSSAFGAYPSAAAQAQSDLRDREQPQ